MRILRMIPVVVLAALLAACGGTAPEPQAEILTTAIAPAESALEPVAATQEAYPVPEEPLLPVDSYLAPLSPTVDPYPAQGGLEESMPSSTPSGANIPLTSSAIGPMLEAIALDLSSELGIDPAEVTFISAEAVVWPDGGLGCPQPDMMYTQVLVEGTLIRIEAGDVTTEYHTDGLNRYVRCDNGRPVSEGIVPSRE